MPPERSAIAEHTRLASAMGDELIALIHEASEQALLGALENPRLEEPQVCVLLERLDLSAPLLEAVAGQRKFLQSEAVRMRLARHPHTPRRIALRLLRQLYLFDVMQVSSAPSVPPEIRRQAEEIVVARLPQLPLGQKLTLARRASARVLGALLGEGHPQVVKPALDNPRMTESQILKALARPETPECVVAAVAQHKKWSLSYHVRMALVRHPCTPFPVALQILRALPERDLKELSHFTALPAFLHKHLIRELARKSGKSEGMENAEG